MLFTGNFLRIAEVAMSDPYLETEELISQIHAAMESSEPIVLTLDPGHASATLVAEVLLATLNLVRVCTNGAGKIHISVKKDEGKAQIVLDPTGTLSRQ